MNIPKSPSLQLLRRLHHQPVGFNDISLSSENDWESESTIIHRHSVSGSSRTSRCSSVLSCALDWEEVDKEVSLPNFIEYKTNEKPNWDFTDEMQRFKSLSDDDEEEEQQDETIMSEGNLDLEMPKSSQDIVEEEQQLGEEEEEENMTPLNRYQRELAKRIFVKNFSDSTSERVLWQFFNQYGKVARVFIFKDRITRIRQRRAFVTFVTMDDAKKVLALDSSKLRLAERQMYISPAKDTRQPSKQRTQQKQELKKKLEVDFEEPSCSSDELNINHLSPEILEHIFSFLNVKERIRIERVCKRWRDIGTKNPWKITELHFKQMFSMYNVMTDSILKSILRRCGPSLKYLDLTDCISRFTYRVLTIIGNYCHKLETVMFGQIPITNTGMIHFSAKCNKLKVAIFQNSPHTGLGEKGLWYLVKNCEDLEVLEIYENHRIKGLCFHIISPKIRRLILNNCSKLMTKGILKLERCKFIEEVELNNCSAIDTSALDFLFKHTSITLKHLSLNGVYPLVKFHLLPFYLLINLEYLSVEEIQTVNDQPLSSIIQRCSKLKYLNISRSSVTNISLHRLNECRLLTTLNISHIDAVDDEIVTSLASLEFLETLILQGNEKVSDNAFALLSSHCLRLKLLDLSSCTEITDITVNNFKSAMKLRKGDHQELRIIGGGTLITEFIKQDGLVVQNSNFCPIHLRPWQAPDIYYYDSDDMENLDTDLDYLEDDYAERLDLYEGRS